jgi:hypothetical protein
MIGDKKSWASLILLLLLPLAIIDPGSFFRSDYFLHFIMSVFISIIYNKLISHRASQHHWILLQSFVVCLTHSRTFAELCESI